MDRMPIRDAAIALLDGWVEIWGTAKAAIAAGEIEQTKAAFDLAEVQPFATALKSAWAAADASTRSSAVKSSSEAKCDVDSRSAQQIPSPSRRRRAPRRGLRLSFRQWRRR